MKMTEQDRRGISIMPTTHLQVLRQSIFSGLVLTTEEIRLFIDMTLAGRGERVVSRETGR